jgi:hypothetical protein
MRVLPAIIISTFLIACDGKEEPINPSESIALDPITVARFNMRNREMREEILVGFKQQNIEFWINDDKSIGYNLVDGDRIDDIITYVYATYWVRN